MLSFFRGLDVRPKHEVNAIISTVSFWYLSISCQIILSENRKELSRPLFIIENKQRTGQVS